MHPLPHGSPAVVFLDRRYPGLLDFYSTVPTDVVKVKSYVNCLFHLAWAELETTINELYFVPERAVSLVVGVL